MQSGLELLNEETPRTKIVVPSLPQMTWLFVMI